MKGLFFSFMFFLILIAFTNCQQGGSTALPPDLTGFITSKIGDGSAIKAVKKDAAGKILEEGILINGAKNGSWITYHAHKDKVVKTVANYVNNELNGIFLTFSDRGQVETLTTYANGIHDGNFAKFKFGNLEESATYINGQIEGIYRKYYQNRNIQMEAEYKNGKQHGFYKYYDDKGNVVMEYEYQNGEKVSGGMKK